jgi:hypothetical protein
MGRLIRILLFLLIAAVALVASVFVASESGEVVVLRTYGEDGRGRDTRLWIIEDKSELWIRAGDPESAWFQRLWLRPFVELTRNGEMRKYEAEPLRDGDVRSWLNRRMAEKYGWADRIVGILGDRSAAIPIRLETR